MFEYVGRCTLIYETGMEGCWFTGFLDDRGVTKNDDYDPNAKDWPKNVPEFHSWDWTFNYSKHGKDRLKVFDKNGDVVFEDNLHQDRVRLAQLGYPCCYLPIGVEFKLWWKWHQGGFKAVYWTPEERHRKLEA